MKAIIYESNTGHTLEYAKMLSSELNIPYYSLKEAKEKLNPRDEIIFLGWVFATKIQGLSKVKKYNIKCIGAVGAYPYDEDYINDLKKSNKIQNLFYLRGGINLQKLKGLKRKILVFVGNTMAKKEPDNKEMIELFQKGVNYVSKDNLKSMIKFLNNNEKERGSIYE